MPDALTAAVVFLFGLAIGSFLNVCIRRLPAAAMDEQAGTLETCRRQLAAITFPPSACPGCHAPIKPYDNIPLLSYLWLRGRCRSCGAAISALYPTVEFLTGLLFIACFAAFGLTALAGKWAVFCGMMVVLVFTDIRQRILPDLITLGGVGLGLAFSLLVPVHDGLAAWLASQAGEPSISQMELSFLDALLGTILLSIPLWVFGEVFSWLIGRPALGFGDVKMMATMGAFLGVKKTFLALLTGAFLGSVIGSLVVLAVFLAGWKQAVAARAARRGLGTQSQLQWALARRYELPFGVFLAVGALISVFFGDAILNWYSSLV